MTSYIDYDFTKDPKYVRGYDPKAPIDKSLYANYADVAHVYPRSDWEELAQGIAADGGGLSKLVKWILNQKQEGSCVGNAWTQGVQIKQAAQFGKERAIPMSAISAYKQIGRSAGSGASVNDALKKGSEVGSLPLDTPENKARFKHTMPATGFSTPFPEGWQSTAAMFRILEWTVVDSVDELVSALFDQHPVIVGRSGHSICYCDPIYKDGELMVGYCNSWGQWGSGLGGHEYGFGFDTSRSISSSSGWAFAIRAITVPEFQTQ